MHPPSSTDQDRIEFEVRVRYPECDPMNVVHHSVYPIWMEMARTEILRQRGHNYRDLESRGVFLVVAKMSLRYRKPAKYDDLIRVRAWVVPGSTRFAVTIDHEYEIYRAAELLVTASTTLACVDRQGALKPLPPEISR
jgi:acyl-CoA thioester hydrolase